MFGTQSARVGTQYKNLCHVRVQQALGKLRLPHLHSMPCIAQPVPSLQLVLLSQNPSGTILPQSDIIARHASDCCVSWCRLRAWERTIRSIIIWAIFIVLTIFYIVPISAIQVYIQVHRLAHLGGAVASLWVQEKLHAWALSTLKHIECYLS